MNAMASWRAGVITHLGDGKPSQNQKHSGSAAEKVADLDTPIGALIGEHQGHGVVLFASFASEYVSIRTWINSR